MYSLHTYCRACSYGKPKGPAWSKVEENPDKLIPVFDLGVQPLANDFRNEEETHSGFAPLQVLYCPRCTLAQLSVVVDPGILYRNYPYVTSGTEIMRKHFERLWHDISMDAGGEIKSVLEIGSNDGKFLKFAKEQGAKVIGVDPAENLVKDCEANGVPTITGFFGEKTAQESLAKLGEKPALIIGRHVICHIDNWKAFIKLVAEIAQPRTLIVFEVPYVADLLNIGAFDTIYHEHLSYMNITAMRHLLIGTPLYLWAVHQYQLHGGCIALVLKHGANDPLLEFEQHITANQWANFSIKARNSIDRMHNVVRGFREAGYTVAGFGASAKSTVWINACKFTNKDLAFIADNTKQKWYKFSPGNNIPITDEGALMRERPRYAILFAWNYRDEVLKTQQDYLKAGNQFIIPIPNLELSR